MVIKRSISYYFNLKVAGWDPPTTSQLPPLGNHPLHSVTFLKMVYTVASLINEANDRKKNTLIKRSNSQESRANDSIAQIQAYYRHKLNKNRTNTLQPNRGTTPPGYLWGGIRCYASSRNWLKGCMGKQRPNPKHARAQK